jgi:hypothetical protein
MVDKNAVHAVRSRLGVGGQAWLVVGRVRLESRALGRGCVSCWCPCPRREGLRVPNLLAHSFLPTANVLRGETRRVRPDGTRDGTCTWLVGWRVCATMQLAREVAARAPAGDKWMAGQAGPVGRVGRGLSRGVETLSLSHRVVSQLSKRTNTLVSTIFLQNCLTGTSHSRDRGGRTSLQCCSHGRVAVRFPSRRACGVTPRSAYGNEKSERSKS